MKAYQGIIRALLLTLAMITIAGCSGKEAKVTLSPQNPPEWKLSIQKVSQPERVTFRGDPTPGRVGSPRFGLPTANTREASSDYSWLVIQLEITAPKERATIRIKDILLTGTGSAISPTNIIDSSSPENEFPPSLAVSVWDSSGSRLWFASESDPPLLTIEKTKPLSLRFLFQIPSSTRDLMLQFPNDYTVFKEEEPFAWSPTDTGPVPIGKMQLIYPESAKAAKLEGTVYVSVEIDVDGKILRTKVLKSFGSVECEEAAVNAVKSVKWKPAMSHGKPVKTSVPLPFKFKMN